MLTLVLAAAALACDAPYGSFDMLGDIDGVEGALHDGNAADANAAAKRLADKVGCLDEVQQPSMIARIDRAIGGGLYMGGDKDGAHRWYLAAKTVDATFEYGVEDFPAGNPLFDYWLDVRGESTTAVPLDGKTLAEGDHYLDGKHITLASAVPDLPHVYQHKTADGVVHTALIEGNAFPEDALVSSHVASNEGGEKKKKEPKENARGYTDADGVYHPPRNRPAEKTPLLIGGGLVALGSGGLYFAASQQRDRFDGANTVDDLTASRGSTNRLVVISAAVLAAGTGALTWGIIVDDTPVIGISGRW